MKQIFTLLFLLFVVTQAGKAQTISPSQLDEYCPMAETVFTVTIIGTQPSVSVTGGATLLQQAYDITSSGSNTTFKFKGRFSDVNQKQEFVVNYRNTSNTQVSYSFEFKKIKSFFFGTSDQTCSLISPAQSTLTFPRCTISSQTFTFTNIKYVTQFENPKTCWGTVTTYEYLLPAGWKLGSTVSNGSTWIAGSNNVTITSDATTEGQIEVRAVNACNASFAKPIQKIIGISRPNPTFTISPASMQIACTAQPTQTFTVSNAGTLSCPASYNWNLGSNNGWLLNGTDAPDNFVTSTNTVTLTQKSGTVLPSTVKVTPVLNGTSLSELSVPISWTTPSYYVLNGGNICTGSSSIYVVTNAPAGSTYYWWYVSSLPNYGVSVVSFTNQTSSATYLNKLTDGVIQLYCTVTNPCGQQTNIPFGDVRVGGYSQTSNPISGYTLAYPPCYTQGCTPQPVSGPIQTVYSGGTLLHIGQAYHNTYNNVNIYNSEVANGTWSLISGGVWSWYASSGNYLQFYTDGVSTSIRFRLTVNNSCGNQFYDFDFYPTTYQYSPWGFAKAPNNATTTYSVTPNPAKSSIIIQAPALNTTKASLNTADAQDIMEITILDNAGRALQKKQFGKGILRTNLDVSKLKPGLYLARIFNGKTFTTVKFVKE